MKITIIGLSLKELKAKHGTGKGAFYPQSWYETEAFFTDKPEPGIYEINIEAKSLTNLTYAEQKEKLPKGFDFPHPAVVAEALITHYKKTGKYLMENWYTRTSLLDSVGYRVVVGLFDADGLDVGHDWGDFRDGDVGVASARKSKENLDPQTLDPLESSSLELRIQALEKWREEMKQANQ